MEKKFFKEVAGPEQGLGILLVPKITKVFFFNVESEEIFFSFPFFRHDVWYRTQDLKYTRLYQLIHIPTPFHLFQKQVLQARCLEAHTCDPQHLRTWDRRPYNEFEANLDSILSSMPAWAASKKRA